MAYDPCRQRPGERVQTRYWFLWAWGRAALAMLTVVAIGFLGSRVFINDLLDYIYRPFYVQLPTPEEVNQALIVLVGFDYTLPVHLQFLDFASDVLLLAPVLGTFFVGGCVAVVAEWYRHRRRTESN